jgi:SAM-dependent methyltransferase
MELKQTQANWDKLGKQDPLYGVLSHAGKRGGQWDEAEFFATGVVEIRGLMAQAAELGFKAGGRALDFGCGVGRLSQALAAHFGQVTGVDIAASMLEKARSLDKSGGKCSFVLNEKANLGIFPDGAFDFVYSHIVLQHMHPRFALGYIAEFVRVLAPGGLLVFQVPLEPQYSLARRLLKAMTPKPLLRFYRSMRYGAAAADAPEIEMNGLPEARVLQALNAAGGSLRQHGGGWYWVTKNSGDSHAQ